MSVLYSTQLTNVNTAGNVKNDGILDDGGKIRHSFFDFLTTGSAQNDTVDLLYLPKNARIVGGRLITEALGASVTLSLGTDIALATGPSDTAIAASAVNLLAATDVSAASNTNFAQTFLLGAGARTINGRTKVYATIAGGTPTTAKVVQGWVSYIQN